MTDLLYLESFVLHYEATSLILLHVLFFVLLNCPYFKPYLFGFCSGINGRQVVGATVRNLFPAGFHAVASEEGLEKNVFP